MFFVDYQKGLNRFCMIDCNRGFKTKKAAEKFREKLIGMGIPVSEIKEVI